MELLKVCQVKSRIELAVRWNWPDIPIGARKLILPEPVSANLTKNEADLDKPAGPGRIFVREKSGSQESRDAT